MLAGHHLLAERLLTPQLPRGRDRAPQPGARRTWRDQGYITARGVRPRTASQADPDPEADPAAGRELRRALLHLLAAPAARRPLRRRRGVRRRPADQVDARPRPPERRSRRSSQSTLGGVGPTASVVVLDNETGGVLAMVGGHRLPEPPFNLATNGHRQPGSSFKPFTLVTALEQGHSTDEVFTSAPQQIPFRAKVPKKNGKGDKVVNELFRVNNYDDNYLGSRVDRQRHDLLRQLRLLTARDPGRGPQNVAATANKMGIETDLVDQRPRVLDRAAARSSPTTRR